MLKLKFAALVTLGLALTIAGLAAASPGQDAKIETGGFELLFNNAGASTASCPRGSVAIGGGLGVDMSAGAPNVAINVSGPLSASDLTSHTKSGNLAQEWYAAGYSGEGSEVDYRVFAVCSQSSQARLRVKRFSVGPSQTRSAIVACPPHQRALGGGLGVGDGPASGVYEISSGPLARSGGIAAVRTGDVARRWLVSVYNGFGVKRSFKALATCARAGDARIVSSTVSINPNSTTEAQTPCPPGRRALGGGVMPVGKPTVDLQMVTNGPEGPHGTIETTDDGDRPAFWDGAFQSRAPRTRNFKVLAICASN